MISAGRVLIIPKGEYNAATAYSMLDLVSYNGSSYIAKQSTTGNLPTNPTYWQLSAYGGSAANIAGNFAQLETTDYASQNYSVGDFLVTKDSELCKVIDTITTGDELVIDTNIEVTTVEEMVADAIDHTDALDAENVKLKGLTAISVQTDLNSVTTLGNYYKSGTSFYVTNAPTGIDSDITAVFRLTVENGSDTTNKYIQTIVTNNGKLYKRGYNGSAWSDWIEYVSKAVADTKQPKTLDTPITIGGTSRTTVEAALGALQSAKADSSGLGTAAAKDSTDTLSSGSTDLIESGAVHSAIQTLTNQVSNKADTSTVTALANDVDDISDEIADMNNILGAKNVLPNNAVTQTINGVTFTVNSDGSITVNGTATAEAWYYVTDYVPIVWSNNSYLFSGRGTASTNINYFVALYDSSYTFLREYRNNTQGTDTIIAQASDASYIRVDIVVPNGATVSGTFYPMIRPASIADDTYVPYAPINRNCAEKSDLTNISETGTTASQAISEGTYFYLNGTLVYAKLDIANGATFTENTNYVVVTAGSLNRINEILEISKGFSVSITDMSISFRFHNTSGNDLILSFFYDISSATRVTMTKDGVRQWLITS